MGAVNWLLWIGGGVVIAAGAVLLGWALVGDRIRGGRKTRRCPRCWYDMSGVPGLTCPECGRGARDERRLHRSRRRWRWAAAAAVIAVIGAGLCATPAVRARGWTALAPTVAVIVYYTGDWEGSPPTWHNNLLYQRIGKGTIPRWQRRLLFWRLGGMIDRADDAPTKIFALRMIESVAYRGGPGGGPTGEATDAAPVLIRAMRDEHANVRAFAAAIADTVGGEPGPLVAALAERAGTDPDGEVRRKAVWGLHALAPHAAGAVDAIIAAAGFEGTPYLQRDALYALGVLDPSTAERSLPTLVAALGSGDLEQRRAAAESLGRLGPAAADATPALAASLAQDEDFVTRREAAGALGLIGKGGDQRREEIRRALVAALEDEEWQVRGNAFVALHELPAEDGAAKDEVSAPLREFLDRTDPAEAAGHVILLARRGLDASPYARWLLARVLPEHSRHWSERMEAAKLLCELGFTGEQAAAAARAMLGAAVNDRERVWGEMLLAQAEGDPRGAVPALREIAARNRPPKGANVRGDLAEALALIGTEDPEVLPMLESMRSDPDEEVRKRVQQAIRTITGE